MFLAAACCEFLVGWFPVSYWLCHEECIRYRAGKSLIVDECSTDAVFFCSWYDDIFGLSRVQCFN